MADCTYHCRKGSCTVWNPLRLFRQHTLPFDTPVLEEARILGFFSTPYALSRTLTHLDLFSGLRVVGVTGNVGDGLVPRSHVPGRG